MKTQKEVEIENLLGRKTIKLDSHNIQSLINDNVILVTGAGGSIGSELCRQIIKYGPKKLLMLDIYENNLYELELDLKSQFPKDIIQPIIASIRDFQRLEEIFNEYKPSLVFHAAAHKHVPLMEDNPIEAIKNNIFGTKNLIDVSDKYNVKRFVLISTDKAVNPTSIMGATKNICEMLIQDKNQKSNSEFVAVRFGNVIESNGSVIPIFKKQIANGGPVTVTHKDINRFFMTIPEAVGLVLEATTYAKGGEIFVLDMGQPIKIYDLAKTLIKLAGLEPEKDIEIKITGLRPGEKLYEELMLDLGDFIETNNSKIFIEEPKENLNIEKKITMLQELINKKNVTKKEIQEALKSIIPTYKTK